MKTYLVPKYPHAGTLKGNTKLHKQNVPFMTIVNGINAAAEKFTEVIKNELNEIVVSSTSYIKDSTDFIRQLKNIMNPDQRK